MTMHRVSGTEALASRVVAAVSVALLSEQVRGVRLLADEVLSRAQQARAWLKGNLAGRPKEALDDLEREPASDDNQADLRKQLARFLEATPSAAATLLDIIPESIDVGNAEAIAYRVGDALSSASHKTGIFKTGRIPN